MTYESMHRGLMDDKSNLGDLEKLLQRAGCENATEIIGDLSLYDSELVKGLRKQLFYCLRFSAGRYSDDKLLLAKSCSNNVIILLQEIEMRLNLGIDRISIERLRLYLRSRIEECTQKSASLVVNAGRNTEQLLRM